MIEIALFAWLSAQPVHSSDKGETDRLSRISQVTESIAVVAGGNRLLAASLAVLAVQEGGLRRDVQHGECPEHLCDHGLARSLFQLHRPPSFPESVWIGWAGAEYSSVLSSTIQAGNLLRAGGRHCGTIEGSFAYYATGGGCVYSGASPRAAMARELASKL